MISPRLNRYLACLCLALAPVAASAQWELDGGSSSLTFITTKNASVAETHTFGDMVGFISPDGRAQVGIDLDSVETAIPIRNKRMRELLFETVQFPTANITAEVAAEVLAAVSEGGRELIDLPITVAMHGAESQYSVPALVTGHDDGGIEVITLQPIIVNAADFNLGKGVAALQEVAGLASISTAVPVSAHLLFTPAAE
jgi:hypothetical protein